GGGGTKADRHGNHHQPLTELSSGHVSSQGCPATESCKRERQAWSHIYDTAARHRHHPQIAGAVLPAQRRSATDLTLPRFSENSYAQTAWSRSVDLKKTYRIAVIPGDGIGKEVAPEGVRALEAVARKHGFDLTLDWCDFACVEYYEKHGRMMPPDWKAEIGSHDAIFFGAVGWPAKVPDHVSLWGSLVTWRREFDQYVDLRPVRLMPGVPCPPLGRKPGDIDFHVVRENTEGEYSNVGGRMFADTEREFVVQETYMTRIGVDRVVKFAFELARTRPRKHLTSATKSNGISITMPYWDERVE